MELDNSYVITPKGSSSTLWVSLVWDGKDPSKPSLLPDGRNWEDIILHEGFESLPENIWLEVWNSGKLVDWLWPGLSERVFSKKMIDILLACGVTGMETLPLVIRRKRSADIDGYSIVRFSNDDARIGYFPPSNPYAWSLLVTEEIINALKERGVTGVTVKPAQKAWAELQ